MVQNQGVREIVLPLTLLGGTVSRLLGPLEDALGPWRSLARGHITLISASIVAWPSPSVSVLCISSYEDASYQISISLSPFPEWLYFNVMMSAKSLCKNKVRTQHLL